MYQYQTITETATQSRELFIKIVLRLCTQNKNSSMNDFNEHPKI